VTGVAFWGDGISTLQRWLGGHSTAIVLHRWLGYAVLVPPLVVVLARPRTVARFLREIVRVHRGEAAWWRRLPGFVLSPRRWPLPRHPGHFDPGQRLMAIALVAGLVTVVASGLLLVFAIDVLGPRYRLVLRTHRWSSVVLGLLVLAHVVVSIGVLPGYRGVWRAMHAPGRGRVEVGLARRLWPEWTERRLRERD
jgi:cytochrome b subunit of formate dehydrogenase